MKKFILVALLLIACTMVGALASCESSEYREKIAGTYYAYFYSSNQGGYVVNKDNYITISPNGKCTYDLSYIAASNGLDPEGYKGKTTYKYNGKKFKLNILLRDAVINDKVIRLGRWYFCQENSLPYETYDNVKYIRYDDDNYQVFGLVNNYVTSVNILTHYNGVKVTSFVERAFTGSKLENVTIPDTIVEIGDQVFENCSELKNVTFMGEITKIGLRTFKECISLKDITIPDSVTAIGDNAFVGCESLKSIVIPNSVKKVGNALFFKCFNLESVTLPDSLTSIEGGMFLNCESLKSVNLPNGITEIGSGAFAGCKSLNNITIPSSVTSICSSAFSKCEELKSIIIPNSITSIGENAFGYCFDFEIYYQGNIAGWNDIAKADNWNKEAVNYTIHCLDGYIVFE
ncbi:MAG: leucine-rich repeat domain-containing protein [Clostridiales bacterium]|nr:leucine-rich repeat domain-containing protein [Clostridiales bacterium]